MSKTTPNLFTGQTHFVPVGEAEWDNCYKKAKTPWHKETTTRALEKYRHLLTNGQEHVTIFFPLCGKAVDMKRFYSEGHSVVGVELVEQAVREFFQEQNLQFTVEDLATGGHLYKTLDGRLRIYLMDVLEFGPHLEKDMDAAYDRGSLWIIDLDKREKYSEIMMSLFAKEFRYLIDVEEFDAKEYMGPPHPMTDKDVHKLFGKRCDLEILEELDGDPLHISTLGLTWATNRYMLLTPKNMKKSE